MKKCKVKIKPGVEAIVFDPAHPPKYVYKDVSRMDDETGIFETVTWQIGDRIIEKGDLILYEEYGTNLMTVIVIPEDAIGKLVEIEVKESTDPGNMEKTLKHKATEETRKAKLVLHHDDPPCDTRLLEDGTCPRCGYNPDMQSTCFYYYCPDCDVKLKKMDCPICKKEFVEE